MLNLNKIVKVIVLDDDILLGNMIVSFLKEERMEAVFQSSLYGAIDAILSFEPDIIVLDVEMGEGNPHPHHTLSGWALQSQYYLCRRMLEDMKLRKV